jgi:hypothetical protein
MCKANPKVVLKQVGDFLDALFDSRPPPHTQTKYHKADKKDVYHQYPNYQRKFGNQFVVQFL